MDEYEILKFDFWLLSINPWSHTKYSWLLLWPEAGVLSQPEKVKSGQILYSTKVNQKLLNQYPAKTFCIST